MATISDLSKGNYIRYNGEIMQVEELQHRTPGNLRAFYQVKMRNLRNGKLAENLHTKWPNAPTACLWEDHFAFVADRTQIEEDTSMVADGKSFKSAIAAGLKLSARGEQMVKKSETDEETTKKTGDSSANHFWNHANTVGHDDEGNLKKFDYETAKPAIEEAQQGSTPR